MSLCQANRVLQIEIEVATYVFSLVTAQLTTQMFLVYRCAVFEQGYCLSMVCDKIHLI